MPGRPISGSEVVRVRAASANAHGVRFFTDRSPESPVGGPGISSNGLLHEVAVEAAGFREL